MERVIKLIKELGASSYKKGVEWNGYQVYEPVYNETMFIGEPTVVLVKGDEIRFSNYDESFEYLKFSQKDLDMGEE